MRCFEIISPATSRAGNCGWPRALLPLRSGPYAPYRHATPIVTEELAFQAHLTRPKKVRMAVARNLGVILNRIWTDGTKFQWEKASA